MTNIIHCIVQFNIEKYEITHWWSYEDIITKKQSLSDAVSKHLPLLLDLVISQKKAANLFNACRYNHQFSSHFERIEVCTSL